MRGLNVGVNRSVRNSDVSRDVTPTKSTDEHLAPTKSTDGHLAPTKSREGGGSGFVGVKIQKLRLQNLRGRGPNFVGVNFDAYKIDAYKAGNVGVARLFCRRLRSVRVAEGFCRYAAEYCRYREYSGIFRTYKYPPKS